ncbi:glycoside hydrolase family 16 protein [Pontibacter anaerobius]|uniref:Glycoside hydrolase family 16 protein n=1 Tax=Pontibacter anaerobius TaxID=2993940 RepID=A0ABT3REK5_9BACT|nr:glycoside hydrolase family 16 protein [Pontibacter anaerobius]MCX2739992.1 glycoside hydrolase family 16 protein [Pontibacter anaerobius]
MIHTFISLLIFSASVTCSPQHTAYTSNDATQPKVNEWAFSSSPVWADEFDYKGKPDNSKWGYDIGGSGWGNNELQYYTDKSSNASVADGVLTITAHKQKKGDKEYTSARLVSKNKGDFLYGRFEVKAKLPTGRGTWPAIWMLPTDWAYGEWPKSGEIDIMEHVGYDQNTVHITVHTEAYNHRKGTQKGKQEVVPTASTDFHLYRVDWTPNAIKGYIDDKQIFDYPNEGTGFEAWPFDKRFHLLLNLAVGGDWGGSKGVDPSVYPQKMEVDYVRVYELLQE